MKKIFLLTLIVSLTLCVNNAAAWPFGKKEKAATEESNLAAEDKVGTADTAPVEVAPATPAEATPAPAVHAAPAEPVASTATPMPKTHVYATPAQEAAPRESSSREVAQATPHRGSSYTTNKKTTTQKRTASKKTGAKKPGVKKTASGTKPQSSAKPQTGTNNATKPAIAEEQTTEKGGSAPKISPAEQQTRAEAAKSVKPAVSMYETKAYELFKDANYDVAAAYFARMASEKTFVFTNDMSYERVDRIVKKYVDAQMAKFLVKGEFEKTAAYVVRVSEANRNKKIQEYADAIFDELKQREKKSISIRDFRLSRYYADDESFLLSSPNGDYVVDVEMSGARSFKNNFYKLQVKDINFTIDTSGLFILSNFTLINPDNNRSYNFNSGKSTSYEISGLEDFYTSRLGKGTPRGNQAVSDSAMTKAFRSIATSNDSAATASPAASEKKSAPTKDTAASASTTQSPTMSELKSSGSKKAPATTAPSDKEPATPQAAQPAEEAKVKVQGNEMTLEN